MSYIGQQLPADVFSGFVTDSFTGDGSATTFTLSKAPFSEDTLIVVINNVIQKPTTNFTVSGTTLTIVGTAVASGDVLYAIHTGGVIPITQASAVTAGATIDLNGGSDKLILDADADTTISADTDDQIDIKIGGSDALKITGSALTGTAVAGTVAQVVSVSKLDSFNTNSTSYVDITGFTAAITPSSTSSKILVISNWMWGSSASPYPKFILLRGSTSINIGNTDTGATRVSVGNNTDPAGDEGTISQEQLGHHFLDSPSSTSEVTYKWQVKSFNSGRTIYVGRTSDVSDGNRATAPSNITLMEILG